MIRQLTVKNLRNLELQDTKIYPGYNLIVGENGQGKTNFLEAIYLLAYGKSFRDEKSKIVNWKEEEARVFGKTDNDTLEIIIRKNAENKVLINNKIKKTGALIGRFVCVIFHPQEIEIVSGAPSLRRSWLDRLISTVDKNYLHSLIEYNKALQNKNKLLKMSAADSRMEVWDRILSKLGAKIWMRRRASVDQINQILRRESRRLTNKDVFIDYNSPLISSTLKESENTYYKQLLSKRAQERRLLATIFGPHRDDFRIIFEQTEEKNILQKEVSSFGSRAEQRQSILLLKWAEARLFAEHFGEAPTILLDDVASELDEKNRQLLTHLYARQVIITTTTPTLLPKQIRSKAKVLKMIGGKLQST
ncbi:MAG: hypothetical protein A2Z11_03960 [Candidatus Woykebacteria bacterium RBG_16_43_9]|uniref:DNA replication and repair protein RecF n=1 Tax=Candidatus Woykebacteria bacterium RBG_16_43_9 TaxID=1802596 RepID=A0A1G1WCY5_9BACT|nr:MAG: hypothetical protein A2Z11_03960 [Candidatus Woykebacteria bacterium RBG_16_43_9]